MLLIELWVLTKASLFPHTKNLPIPPSILLFFQQIKERRHKPSLHHSPLNTWKPSATPYHARIRHQTAIFLTQSPPRQHQRVSERERKKLKDILMHWMLCSFFPRKWKLGNVRYVSAFHRPVYYTPLHPWDDRQVKREEERQREEERIKQPTKWDSKLLHFPPPNAAFITWENISKGTSVRKVF